MIARKIAELSREESRRLRKINVFTDQIRAFIENNPPWESWSQRLIPRCQCCGEFYFEHFGDGWVLHGDITRCPKHIGRNPCSVEGCHRTFKAQGDGNGYWYSNDAVMCGRHWRELIPPGSPERRVVNRIFRLGRKLDWPEEMENRYWRVWPRLLAIARARAAGDIDEAEIKKMFGWE